MHFAQIVQQTRLATATATAAAAEAAEANANAFLQHKLKTYCQARSVHRDEL